MTALPDRIRFDSSFHLMPNSVQTGIDFLMLTCPNWAVVRKRDSQQLTIDAHPMRSSGKLTRLFNIQAFEDQKTHRVRAKELEPTTLPKFCPERHINPDGTFCLSIEATTVKSTVDGAAWWKKLELFLTVQETASSMGVWPRNAQMAHGEAGSIQLELEEICEEMGLQNELRSALYHQSGPIFDSVKEIRKTGDFLRNGRSECICGRKGKSGNSLLRRQCKKLLNGCPARLMYSFVQAEKKFWYEIKDKECCGTMKNCPLRTGKV